MGVIQCGIARRINPYCRSISATLLYCTFQSPYVPYGLHFHDRNPRRHAAASGLKAQRPSTSCRCRSAEFHHNGGIPTPDDIIERVLLRPVSGAFGGTPPSRATESVQPIHRIEQKKMSNADQESWSRVKEHLRT